MKPGEQSPGFFRVNTCMSKQIFASPNGQGVGTIQDPTSLQNGLLLLTPGDCLLLRAGEYVTDFDGLIITTSGTVENGIIKRVTIKSFNYEKVIINGTFKCRASYVDIIGLTFTAPNIFPPNTMTRFGNDKNSYTFNLLNKLMPYGSYTWEGGIGCRVINNIFYNSPGQVECGSSSSDIEFYGNVFANLGCNLSDNESGEGIYLQSSDLDVNHKKLLSNNFFVNCALAGMDLWSQTSSSVNGVSCIGNIAANNGDGPIQGAPQLNLAAAKGVSNCFIFNNVFFQAKDASMRTVTAAFGRPGFPPITNTTIINNYFIGNGPSLVGLDSLSSFCHNTLIDGVSAKLINNQGLIDYNNYYKCFLNQEVDNKNIGNISTWFNNWKNLGYDLNGASKENDEPTSFSLVFPNKYRSGRCNVAIINPQANETVKVNLINCGYKNGDKIYMYNTFDLSQPPREIIYSNPTIDVSTKNLTVKNRTNAAKNWNTKNSAPYFCAFLLSKDPL